MLAINEAVDNKLGFGRDVICTFGPFSSIYTLSYHPSTDSLTIMGACWFAFTYWMVIKKLNRTSINFIVNCYCLLLFIPFIPRDPLLFSYPLVTGILGFTIQSSEKLHRFDKASVLLSLQLVCIWSTLGLLPLIKGSLLVPSAATALLVSGGFVLQRQLICAALAIFSPLFSLCIFWVISGQALSNLGSYLSTMIQIISGYSEAMAITGENKEVTLYVASAVSVCLVIFFDKKLSPFSKAFALANFLLFFLISFKAGFVRHDGHAVIASWSLLLGCVAALFIVKIRFALVSVAFCFWTSIYIGNAYLGSVSNVARESIVAGLRNAYSGVQTRIFNYDELPKRFGERINEIANLAAIPTFDGSVDIYSVDQADLIATENDWNPRPIFQSYSAYTPKLAELNEAHLRSVSAPDYIVFRLRPIDGHLPALEDGLSWPTFISNYEPIKVDATTVFLKRSSQSNGPANLEPIADGQFELGQEIRIPDSRFPVFGRIDIGKTVKGHLLSVLYKPSSLELIATMANGSKRRFRVISSMLKSGFIVSPLVESSLEFAMLFGDLDSLAANQVRAFKIRIIGKDKSNWQRKISVSFSAVKNYHDRNLKEVVPYNSEILFESSISMTAKFGCEGSIDSINGYKPGFEGLASSKLLSITGWTTNSGKDGLVPTGTFITLTKKNDTKERIYYRTNSVPRSDVNLHFARPNLKDPGFYSIIDVSELKGEYFIGISRLNAGVIEVCENLNFPFLIF